MSTVTVSAAQTRVKTSELEIEHVRIPEPAFAPAGTKGVTIISSLTLAHGHADSWTTLCRALAHLATARPESHGRTHRSFHRKTRSKAVREAFRFSGNRPDALLLAVVGASDRFNLIHCQHSSSPASTRSSYHEGSGIVLTDPEEQGGASGPLPAPCHEVQA